VFGSHVANVLRRLRRIAAAYGTEPRILLASATIANPLELAERLTGLEQVTLIDEDGSPSAGRRIAIWNPPVTDEALGVRRSALAEGAELLARLVADGARTICFVRSRKGVELLSRITRDELERLGAGALSELVMPYRAGYTPAQRREIEQRLVAGELRAVVTTDALELGIDVGTLDAAVVVTFPGRSPACGRCGVVPGAGSAGWRSTSPARTRSTSSSRATPTISSSARGVRDPRPRIRGDPPRAPAVRRHEGPLSERDAEFFGPRTLAYLERLEGLGELRAKDGQFVLRRRERYPAGEISLRSGVAQLVRDRRLQQRRGARQHRGGGGAFSTLHPGAIYLHLGRSFHVRELDLETQRARSSNRSTRTGTPAQARDRYADRTAARPPRGARGEPVRSVGCWSPRRCSPTSAGASDHRRST